LADKTYSAIAVYIHDHRLNKAVGSDSYDADTHDPKLKKFGEDLLQHLGGVEWAWIEQRAESVFEAVKIVMAHFRRIRELAGYEREGLVEFIESALPEGPP
jgi:hypothetical protein